MKRIFCVLFILTYLISAISSCKKQENYTDEISTSTLSARVQTALTESNVSVFAEDSYLDAYFTRPDFVTEQTILYSGNGNNLNEIGIFHTTDGNAKKLEKLLNRYLSASLAQNQAYYNSYIPEETPKLQHAEVRSFGNYVTYAILNEHDRNVFFATIEKELKK
jgi:hypothetical protein